MPKLSTPFTKIECPICRRVTDLSTDRDSLAQHIQVRHKNMQLVPIARSLYQALNQSVPDNLDKVEVDEMATVLANICKDAANKQGLGNLRKRRHGKRVL